MIGLTIALVIYFQTGKPVADAPATVNPAMVAPFLNQ
jgi:hypothetical protein